MEGFISSPQPGREGGWGGRGILMGFIRIPVEVNKYTTYINIPQHNWVKTKNLHSACQRLEQAEREENKLGNLGQSQANTSTKQPQVHVVPELPMSPMLGCFPEGVKEWQMPFLFACSYAVAGTNSPSPFSILVSPSPAHREQKLENFVPHVLLSALSGKG